MDSTCPRSCFLFFFYLRSLILPGRSPGLALQLVNQRDLEIPISLRINWLSLITAVVAHAGFTILVSIAQTDSISREFNLTFHFLTR